MNNRLTQKEETFALLVFSGVIQREAWGQAGYSTKYSIEHIDHNASVLANSNKVQTRLKELRQAAEDTTVATVLERKQRLSEVVRANVPDFVADGAIAVEKQSPNVGAVSEITTRTRVFRKGGEPVNITNLKLHSPIQAIAELNKMERVYEPDGGTTINNQIVNIIVMSEEDKKNIERVMEGEGT